MNGPATIGPGRVRARRLVSGALLGAGVLAVAAWLGWGEGDVAESTDPTKIALSDSETRAALTRLEGQLGYMNTALAQQRRALETVSASVEAASEPGDNRPGATAPADEGVSEQEVSDAERTAQADARLRRQQSELDAQFSAQPRDPTWAPEMEAKLVESAGQQELQSRRSTRLVRAECKSSLCRAEFVHETEAGWWQFQGLFDRELSRSLSQQVLLGDLDASRPGHYVTRLYLSDGALEMSETKRSP